MPPVIKYDRRHVEYRQFYMGFAHYDALSSLETSMRNMYIPSRHQDSNKITICLNLRANYATRMSATVFPPAS